MLPAHAGMILPALGRNYSYSHVTRTRGDDPDMISAINSISIMLPAHAGMILLPGGGSAMSADVTRTRGDDPSDSL